MKNIILKFSGFLLLGHLLNWWLLFYSTLNIPERIPKTPININGLIIIVLTIIILIFFQKQILNLDNRIPILRLTFLGAIVCFIAELFFQAIRFPTITADSLSGKIYYFLRGITIVPLMGTIFSFLVALQLKTKRTGLLVLAIIIFYLTMFLLKYFFPSLFE